MNNTKHNLHVIMIYQVGQEKMVVIISDWEIVVRNDEIIDN